MSEYAKMDSHMARAQMAIGMSSNLAQLAMTYYWSELASGEGDEETLKQLSDNFVILSVIAQIAIDGIKREYSVDAQTETDRIAKMRCMTLLKYDRDGNTYKCDFPAFMKHTRTVRAIKNGRFRNNDDIANDVKKLNKRINYTLQCPMNWVEEELNNISRASNYRAIDELEFLVPSDNSKDQVDYRQLNKVNEIFDEFTHETTMVFPCKYNDLKEYMSDRCDIFEEATQKLGKIKINSQKTMLALIRIGMGRYTEEWNKKFQRNYISLLNLLYHSQKRMFLSCFKKM